MSMLRRKIQRLQDENESLWDMIDEIKASDIKNHNMTKEIDMIVEKTKNRLSQTIGMAKIVSKTMKKDVN
tara:strand:- start:93 stop:302 length:210 start_codon:yes stop_codon:yes gene_type:complete